MANQMKRLKETFVMFDKNGDGTIEAAELGVVMRCAGLYPSEQEVEQMIRAVDADKSGKIDFEEFVILMANHTKDRKVQEEFREAFRLLDDDKDGFIEVAELKHLLLTTGERLTEEEVQDMFKFVGVEQDGRINCEEFISLMTAGSH